MLIGGRYQLETLAGRGGTGEVWRAEALGAAGFTRTVAVKRVLASHMLSNQDLRAMFIEEARVNSRLDHPNVVQVFDFGEDEAGFYLVMEWVEGINLRDFVDTLAAHGKTLSPALVGAIGIEVLHALEAAHSHTVGRHGTSQIPCPIIHRDVSPSNVLMSLRGVIKLADFGFARAFDRSRMTPVGIVKGKLGYLSPEQVRGEPASAQSDLYACGVMLWEILCNRRLYPDKSDRSIALALMKREPHAPVRSLNPDVPEALAAAVDRAVAIESDARYPSATDFSRALCDALRGIRERTDATRIGAEVANVVSMREAMSGAASATEGSGPVLEEIATDAAVSEAIPLLTTRK